MGLFSSHSFKKTSNIKDSQNIDIAEQMLSFFIGIPVTHSSKDSLAKAKSIVQQCPTNQDVFNKIIELCGEPKTSRQRYILAEAYAISRVAFRKQAIYYLQLYLSNPPYEDAYIYSHHLVGHRESSVEEEKNIHLGHMYDNLGKAYEGEYEFEKALECYKKELELTPFWPVGYYCVACILIKQGKMNEAMQVYLNAKLSPYYEPIKYKSPSGDFYVDNVFKRVIDEHIAELQEKINRGYVYRPRKGQKKEE